MSSNYSSNSSSIIYERGGRQRGSRGGEEGRGKNEGIGRERMETRE